MNKEDILMNAIKTVQPIGIEYVIDYYESFLSARKAKNEKTYINYKSDIQQFFSYLYNKEWMHVTMSDILNTKTKDAFNYYTFMSTEKGYKVATIKRKINAVRSFFKYISADIPKLNHKIFDNLDLSGEDMDKEERDTVDWKEAEQMWEYARYSFGLEGKQMSMLIKLACVTSFRLESLLSLTWEEHFYVKNEKGVNVNYIEVKLKRKVDKKAISNEMFNELKENLGVEGKLFYSLHKHKVGKYVKKIVADLGFDSRRNISFHSFKGTGVNRVLEVSGGNMQKAQVQGGHSSINTTQKYYAKYSEELTAMPSYTIDKQIDVQGELNKHSVEDIMLAINKLTDSAKYELINILKG